MKNWRKVLALVLVLALSFSLVACGTEKPASSTPNAESSVASTPVESEPEEEPTDVPGEEEFKTERTETVYFGGMQWGKPNNMNPLSPTPNFFIIEQSNYARIGVWETLYMYNLLTNEIYPLLADGDPEWNADRTVMTIKINPDAKWSDGTPVTAADVVATFDIHVKHQSTHGIDYSQYIESITAVDDLTAEFKTVSGENYNPLKLLEYLPKIYVMQASYIEELDAKVSGDSTAFKQETMWDAPTSGPYTPVLYDSEQKVVLERDEEYWGQAASMWGKLPVPKYLVHNIYSGNETSAVGFQEGNIDINQQYVANLQNLWLDNGLPISTYLDEAPYQIAAGMPSLFLNQSNEFLQVKEIRKALAMSIDYDQIVDSAMTGQSPTFDQYPRSLFNPTDGEQALIRDQSVLDEYRWNSADVEGAKALLDEAGIVDSDGDGIREYNGKPVKLTIQCPTGWTDWMAAVEISVDGGNKIGFQVESSFPEAAQHIEDMTTGNFEIGMYSVSAAGISNPWTRAYEFMYGFGGNFPDTLTFAYSRYYNAEVDEILKAIPSETDEAKLMEYYERLNIIYLDEVPNIALLYRPAVFHEVNESVWTNFPSAENNVGKDIPIPPQCGFYGYGIAALYELELVG